MDGHIVGSMISANSITGEQIQANSIKTANLELSAQQKIQNATDEETVKALIKADLDGFESTLSKEFITVENATTQIQQATEVAVKEATQNIIDNAVSESIGAVDGQLNDKLNQYTGNTLLPAIAEKAEEVLQNAEDYVVTKLESYATKQELSSSISQTREQIELSVSEKYTTKAESTTIITEAIDGITVGAINRVLGTGENKSFKFNGGANETWLPYKFSNDISDKEVFVSFKYTLTGTAQNGSQIEFAPSYLKKTNNQTVYRPKHVFFTSDRLQDVNITDTVSFTTKDFQDISSSSTSYIRFVGNGFTGTLSVSEAQIKQGNSKTSWSPAPEDTITDITNAKNDAIGSANNTLIATIANYYTKSETDSAISVAKDEINLGVSNKYETKTNVETKVSSTLNSAKSYADTKKSEAISTASSDATNKANNALSSAKSYTDTAKNDLNTAIGKKANSADVYTKTEVYTKSQTDSQIKATKDAINLNVSQTYETKTNVQTQINNIQVGGTNLVQNSDFSNGTSKWSSVSPWGIHSTTTYGGKKVCYISRSGLTSDSWAELKSNNISCKQGEMYTMSVDIKTSGLIANTDTATLFIWSYDTNGGNRKDVGSYALPTSTDWIRYKCTGTIPSGSTIVRACITVKRNGTVYATNFKLEKGNKATDWSPCPSDVNGSITSAITESKNYADSQIKIAKDSINLGVSQTYETKTNVSSQINNTLSSAKSYADTKKSEAISSASSDATTKANNALSSAKSYADTKKTEAINSANNTLNTTIANYYTKSQTDSQINVAKNAITQSVSNTYETKTNVNTLKNQINQTKQNIRCNDLGAKINYSDFSTANAGEIYLHGYDANNNPTDTNGKVYWNGATLTVVKGMINPNSEFPFNTDVYIFINKTNCSTRVYGCYYNTSTKAWAYKSLIGGTDSSTNWTPDKNHVALGVFSMSDAETFNHAYLFETPQSLTQLTVGSANLTSRMNSAESKITDTAITNVVKQNFYTKSETDGQITSKGYQTASQVQQTVNNLQLKFTQSGGYNLFSNSGFKKGTSYWSRHTHNSPTGGSIGTLTSSATWGFPDSTVNCVQIRLSNQSGKEYGIAQAVKTTIGKKYTLSFYYAGHRLNQINAIVRNSSGGWLANKYVNTLPSGGNTNVGNWNKYTLTFTANATSHSINIVIVSAADDGYLWVAKPMVVEGELDLPYSPHPSEIYDGIIEMDKEGITVTASNVRSKTKMAADGFQLIRTTDNKKMFYVNQDGSLEMSGNFTQYDTNGKISIKIANNSYGCYDWLWDGDFVGKFGAFESNRTNTSGANQRFIGISNIADYGNQLVLGVRSSPNSTNFNSYIEIDNTSLMHRDYVTFTANTGFKTNALFRNPNNNYEAGRIFGATNNHFFVTCNHNNQLRLGYEKNGSYYPGISIYRNDNTSAGCAIEYHADEVHHNNVVIEGFLSVRGQKNRLVATENFGDRLLNAYETAECYFGDINEAIIGEDGEVKVELDEVFLETVNTTEPYQVFLTKYGEGDCYVSERHEKYFIIKGTPNLSVGFEIKAKQRGYEKERLKMAVNTLKSHQATSSEDEAGYTIDCETAINRA